MTINEMQEKLNLIRNDLTIIGTELRKANETSNRKTRYVKLRFNGSEEEVEKSWKHITATNPKIGIQSQRNTKYTKDEFNKLLLEIKPERIEIVGEYINKHTKTKFKNFECGHEFDMTPNDVHRGNTLCPICKQFYSYGEILLQKYFEENNIKFIKQKTFHELRLKKALRIDFYIPDKNIAIEFQGKQHFIDTDSKYRDSEGYDLIKLRDDIKKEFCFNNNIELLYLDYKMIEKGKFNSEALDILSKI